MSNPNLPDNIRPIWTPQDAIDTAQAFAAELDNAERGIKAATPKPKPRLFTQSRYRKAKFHDGCAVALLMAVMAALGVITFALCAPAKADSSDAIAYASDYGGAVCATLDKYPTVAGVYGIGQAIVESGDLSAYDAGQAIAYSVADICPRHWALIMRVAGRGSAAA